MGLSSLVSRTRTAGLAAALLVGGVLVAQAAPAAAAPTPTPAPRATSTTPAAPSSTGSTSSSVAGSTSAASTTTGSTSSSRTGKPAATAPPAPADYGPPCTTNADKLYPVICLPDGSGEDRTASVTAGDDIEFDAQVVNNGPAVADADVVITLPKGLQLESDEDDPVYRIENWYDDGDDDGDFIDLTCSGGPTTITCRVGALDTHANILIGIDLEVADDAVPNTTQTFQVALQPVGLPTYPETSVSASLLVLEPSHLAVSLTPATLRTVVGHHATITGTVRNLGSGAAPDTIVLAIDVNPRDPRKTHFSITNGTDLTGAGGSTVIITGARAASVVQARLQRQALARSGATVQRHAVPSILFWPLGTIASGAVKEVPIKLKANSLGTDTLLFAAVSSSGDGADDCGDDDSGGGSSSASGSEPPSATAVLAQAPQASTTSAPADCSFQVQTHITAVRAPAASAPLADTGTHGLDTELGIAVWTVVLGAGLVWVGRRRRIATGRHQG